MRAVFVLWDRHYQGYCCYDALQKEEQGQVVSAATTVKSLTTKVVQVVPLLV